MKNILIIDSGSGGVNVLFECLKLCPNNNYLLYIDQKNLPYGNKNSTKLKKIAVEIIENNKNFNPEIIIIGCNTLTSVAINFLREKYKDLIFIGSEPAIKPALKEFEKDEILVIATEVTINNSKPLKNFQDICFCPKELPQIVDDNLFDRGKIIDYLKLVFKNKTPKALVLGCTHFEGIKHELKDVFENVRFFGSAEGIARRLLCFCHNEGSMQNIKIVSSTKEDEIKFKKYFNYLMSKYDQSNQN